ncbi:MAG: histidinol-phosphatase HisJ family protein [Ruminococcaceae bacterium]|nr:histidinol-phosphatase HisJ family protein [Oscillospiraceae bacterium]
MIKSNLHTHSTYSDGKNTLEEMIETAIEKGFVSLGFSDHGYTDFDTSYCISREGELEYRRELIGLKEKYRGQLDIFSGIEMDCFGDAPDYDYDYTIGSVHYVKANGAYHTIDLGRDSQRAIVEEQFGGSFNDMAKAFYEQAAEAVILRKPDIVGHFDLITKYSLFDTEDPVYRDAALSALREVMKHCTLFEVNTGAIARGLRTNPYPDDFLLREIQQRGGRVILGSDCHYREKLDVWFTEGVQYIRSLGFKSISRLTPSGFVEDTI